MALEIDGVRWSLKGINGGAVPMVGLLRNVEVDIGGHRFDHHFFVSTEGTGNQQDVLLGQPWLHWYSANLAYSRKGSTLLKLWKNGDSDTQYECGYRPPTIAIQLCTADTTFGKPKTITHATAVEEYDSDDSGYEGKGKRVCGPRAI
jgi:hypothetical protein